jgi:hypothetical protein
MTETEVLLNEGYKQLASAGKRSRSQIDPDVVAAIDAQAKRLGVSRAWVVRYALTEYAVRLMEKQS